MGRPDYQAPIDFSNPHAAAEYYRKNPTVQPGQTGEKHVYIEHNNEEKNFNQKEIGKPAYQAPIDFSDPHAAADYHRKNPTV